MSSKICEMHMLVPGKYYDLIFQELNEKITLIDKLGKLVSISFEGRPYDPDVYMKFIKKTEKNIIFILHFHLRMDILNISAKKQKKK